MTLALTDIGSLQKFSKWNQTPKGSLNFSNVRVYLFVETRNHHVHSLVVPNQKYDPHINRHRFPQKKFSKWSRTPKGLSNFGNVRIYLFGDTIVITVYRVVSNQKYDPRIYRHRFPKKNLSKWNRTPKGSSIFGNTRTYLFVGTLVTIVYRVSSCLTKSTTLAFTDIGFQKKNSFKMKPNAERLVNFW